MPFLIAIAGGSGSGKTTLAIRLAQTLGGDVTILSEDRYYVDRKTVPDFDPLTFNFDDVASRDYDLMKHDIALLKSGNAIDAPQYCFVTHSRKSKTETIYPTDIMIFEGIHLLHDESVREVFDLKIFIDTPDDLRIIRRLLRDTKSEAEGGREREWRQVIDHYLMTVRKSHTLFTEPGRSYADIVVINDTDDTNTPDTAALDALLKPVLDHPKLKR